jgi:hypothetical protein
MSNLDSSRYTAPKEELNSLPDLDNLLSQGLIEGIPPTDLAAQYGVSLGRVRAILVGVQHGAR